MRMWFLAVFVTLVSGFVTEARADDILASAGRLEWAESDGTCSAALIADDLVVTAAHCVDPADLETEFPRLFYRPAAPDFAAPIAVVGGTRHPLYAPGRADQRWRFPFDLAVLQLARGLPERTNPPLNLGSAPTMGEKLTLLTWTRKGEEPLVRPCQVLPGAANLVSLGCVVEGGESGGAVLRRRGGLAEIVAVLTSRSRIGALEIGQATRLEGRLTPILRRLEAGE